MKHMNSMHQISS